MIYDDFESFFKDIYNYVKTTNQQAYFEKIKHDKSFTNDALGDAIYYFTLYAKFNDGKIFSMAITPFNFNTTKKLSKLFIEAKTDFPTVINKQLLPFI